MRLLFVMVAVLAAFPAWAEGALEILGPEGAVAAAPFEIALVRAEAGRLAPADAPTLSAEGAQASPLRRDGLLWRATVTPRAGARTLRLEARDGTSRAQAVFRVGPPAEQVALSLTPAAPVKGRDREATIDIRLRSSGAAPDAEAPPPVLRANVGTIENLERVGPGAFRARYVLPTTRYPEVIVLVAFSAWPSPASIEGAAGSLVVPLATAIDLPGRTEPGASTVIEIAHQRFGPVRAGADGHFQIPVVVPPGHRFAKNTVVDRIGNRRVEKVDLALPPTDPLACVMTPRTIPLGTGAARVLCATTDPYGKPLDAAAVTLRARRGRLSGPTRAGRGLLEWRYQAPSEGTEPDTLQARWRRGGPLAKESLEVGFEQGPVASLGVTTTSPLVFRGGSEGIEVEARDGRGRLREDAILEATASEGAFTDWRKLGPGRWGSRYAPAPAGEAGAARLEVSAFGPTGTEPAALRAWRSDGQVKVAVVDLAGLPVPNQPLEVDGREQVTDARGLAAFPAREGLHLISHRRWPGLRTRLWVLGEAPGLFPAAAPLLPARASATVSVAPPVPVNVRIQVAGRTVRYWAEDADGRVLPERPLAVTLSSGSSAQAAEVGGVRTLEVPGTARVTVSVADPTSGVTAVAEVAR